MQADVSSHGVKAGDEVGPYKLLRQIGAGATGQVFEVEHKVIGRKAALKVLYPDHALLPSAMRRLFAEAQAVNRINHPHIVEITDVVEGDRSGSAAGVVMELLDGLSLAELIAGGKRLEPARLPHIMGQVADALGAAHAAGFVHRDLKPENIFITARDGVRDYVKLLDFGLAKSLVVEESNGPTPTGGTLPGRAHRTIEGTFLGTPAYASPEQAAGKPVDHRTDIYAFGVILYELLCGRLPFEGQNLGEYLVKHITVMPPPVPEPILASELGAGLAEVAMRCLRKDPAHRYASASEIKEQLLALPPAGPSDLPQRAPGFWATMPEPRKRVAVGIAAVGAAAVGLVLTLLVTSGPRPEPVPEDRPAATPVVREAPIVPAPPPVRRVTVTFHSRPAGAEVRRVGDPELLGITPFDETFAATDQTVDFELRLPGHEPRRVQAHLGEDGTVTGQLRRRRTPAAGSPQRNDQLRERTLDPWRP